MKLEKQQKTAFGLSAMILGNKDLPVEKYYIFQNMGKMSKEFFASLVIQSRGL